MSPEHRQMWADLYKYFENVSSVRPESAVWPDVGTDGAALVEKYNGDTFVHEVVCATIGYWKMKNGQKETKT